MPMENLVDILNDLELQFPEYSFSIGKRVFKRCIVAKNTRYTGADIVVKQDGIVVRPAVPESKTRLLFGSGGLIFKLFNKKFDEPSLRIFRYLNNSYERVRLNY